MTADDEVGISLSGWDKDAMGDVRVLRVNFDRMKAEFPCACATDMADALRSAADLVDREVSRRLKECKS